MLSQSETKEIIYKLKQKKFSLETNLTNLLTQKIEEIKIEIPEFNIPVYNPLTELKVLLKQEEELIKSIKEIEDAEKEEENKKLLLEFKEEEYEDLVYLERIVDALIELEETEKDLKDFLIIREKLLNILKKKLTEETLNFSIFQIFFKLNKKEAIESISLKLTRECRIKCLNFTNLENFKINSLTKVYEIYADCLDDFLKKINYSLENSIDFTWLFDKFEEEGLNQFTKFTEITKEKFDFDRKLVSKEVNLSELSESLEILALTSLTCHLYKKFLSFKLHQSHLFIKKVNEFMKLYYTQFELKFLKESLKIIKTNLSVDLIEDFFYIFKLVLNRSLNSNDFYSIEFSIKLILQCLEKDYYQSSLKLVLNSDLILFLNYLELSFQYFTQLVNLVREKFLVYLEVCELFGYDKSTTSKTFDLFLGFTLFEKELEYYLNNYYLQQIKPLVKIKENELFSKIGYFISEEEFSLLEEFSIDGGVLIKGLVFYKFITGLNEIIIGVKGKGLSEGNFNKLIKLICLNLIADYERFLFDLKRVSYYGSMKLEYDLRGLYGYFSFISDSTIEKDLFQKLFDFVYLLGLDGIQGLDKDDVMVKRLSLDEVRSVLLMRFSEGDVDKLQLTK